MLSTMDGSASDEKHGITGHGGFSLPNLSQRNPSKGMVQLQASEEYSSVPRFDFVRADQEDQVCDTQKGHERRAGGIPESLSTSSVTQSNLSFIDMYRDRDTNSSISQESATEASDTDVPLQGNIHSASNQQSFSASSTDLLTLKNSRNNVSKIRLSIEESRTKVSSTRDRYGFKKRTNFVSEDQYNSWWVDYAKHCTRRKKKWIQLLAKNGLSLNIDSPVRFPPRSEKLKRYVRKGIPAEWRGNAWWFFAKGPEKLQNNVGVYDTLIESTFHLRNKDTEIIERDLNRTFPDNIHFKPDVSDPTKEQPETALIEALRRVLVAFSAYNPAIGYCQSLNFIAGLLLIFMDEEKAFWMLVIITSRFLPGVHEVNLEGVNVDQGVLMLALKEYLPATWNVISSIDFERPASDSVVSRNNDFLVNLPPITLCTSSWFMSAFIGILPIETTLRVWDCLFYEESSCLFKVSLGIFKLIEPKALRMSDEMEIFQIIQNTPKTLIDPRSLFDVVFGRRLGYNHLNQEEVLRCKKYVTERRQKAKLENPTKGHDTDFNRKLLAESLWQPDLYGFKKGLPGVHWNKNLRSKMRAKIKRNM